MIDSTLLSKIENHYKRGLPFVLYSLPESSSITILLQEDNSDYEPHLYSENAFHFYPFDDSKRGYCIPYEKATINYQSTDLIEVANKKLNLIPEKDAEKEYTQLFEKTIKFISNKKAEKVVISRKVSVAIKKIAFEVLLKRLFGIYPHTFRYLWFHPITGLWCGATPELLLQSSEGYFSTMALAGTMMGSPGDKVFWGEKERNEHQIVVDDIINKLQNILSVIKVSKTHTYEAGPLLHLKTDISGQLKKGKTSLPVVAANLHPTPAVCGVPRSVSKKFILENENYNREMYTGYLGPINGANDNSYLFVNLRCMKLEKNQAHIFVGGGITNESNTADEWKETQNKMQPMLQVLQPFI